MFQSLTEHVTQKHLPQPAGGKWDTEGPWHHPGLPSTEADCQIFPAGAWLAWALLVTHHPLP